MMNKNFLRVIAMITLLLILIPNYSYADVICTEKVLALTKEEEEYLASHNTFYYAIAVDYAPIEYLNHQGEPKGFGVEYLKEIGELLGVQFIPVSGYQQFTWEDCMNALQKGQIDLLPTISNTKERREYISFTDPYLVANIVVVGNDDEHLILQAKDMKGSKIILPNKYWQNEYIKSQLNDDVEIINTNNILEALYLINQNKGDYTFLESTVYNYYRQLGKFDNLKIVGEILIEADHCIGVMKENEILRDILNKVIPYVNKEEIYKEALVVERESQQNKALIIVFIGFTLALLIIILYLLKRLVSSIHYRKNLQKSKQKLIENLSHDLKTPLSTLKVNLNLLEKGIVQKNEKEKYYKLLDKNINNIDYIIDELYYITHVEESLIKRNVATVYVKDFLQELFDLYKDVFNKQNKKLTYIKDDYYQSLAIKIDEKSMHRAISNLLSNALKFTDENDEVLLSYKYIDSQVVIIVTDNGIGIDKNSISHVFDRFYQSDDLNRSGKGLGLAITKEIVEWHKGKITVSSKENQFTTFRIILPSE